MKTFYRTASGNVVQSAPQLDADYLNAKHIELIDRTEDLPSLQHHLDAIAANKKRQAEALRSSRSSSAAGARRAQLKQKPVE